VFNLKKKIPTDKIIFPLLDNVRTEGPEMWSEAVKVLKSILLLKIVDAHKMVKNNKTSKKIKIIIKKNTYHVIYYLLFFFVCFVCPCGVKQSILKSILLLKIVDARKMVKTNIHTRNNN
jgi:hypothetical protein